MTGGFLVTSRPLTTKMARLGVVLALCSATLAAAAPVQASALARATAHANGSTSSHGLVARSVPGPTREVFGFALASSLADPTVGYTTWNYDLLSTIAFFSIHVSWDGNLVTNDSRWTEWNSSDLTGMVNLAHANGVKVVLTILVGDSTSAQNLMCSALSNPYRQTTISQTVAQVKAKGVDGVNIDYEGQLQTSCAAGQVGQSNQNLMTAFTQDLRAALNAAGNYYLSIDTYSASASGNDGFFNIGAIAPYVDSFFVMAYDMDYYDWPTAKCGYFCMNPVSPLSVYVPYNDTISMSQYSAVAGPGKVILGLPYYGRVACVSIPIANEHPTTARVAATYLDAAAVSSSSDVKPGTYAVHRDQIDPAGHERWDSWYDLKDNCWKEMYWDDAESLSTRYSLVNRDGIRGVGFWTLNYGGGAAELWAAIGQAFGGWSATYDMSKAPTAWVAGISQTFTVTVTNNSLRTWPVGTSNPVDLDLHFASSAGGSLNQAAWLTSQAFSLPKDVAPGQSVTVNVTVTAPAGTGSMVLEAEMIKEHEFWFDQWEPVNVTVAAQNWSASYDMSSAPTAWATGQSQTFPVTVTNTGNTTWPHGPSYTEVDLDLHFASSAGGSNNIANWLTSQAFSLPNDVAPGQSVTVSVKVTPPAKLGSAVLEAEMIKEHQFWFQQWQATNVSVVPPSWSASYDMSKAPATWAAGQSQTFPVTVTNTGNTTWPSTGYYAVDLDLHFATQSGGSAKLSSWLTSQAFSLPNDVAPGQSVTVNVKVMPPTSIGSLVLEAEMIKEHQFWFQQWQAANVTVTAPSWSASYDLSKAPVSWSKGQTQSFQVVVTNTGNVSWPSTGYYEVDVDLHFTTQTGGAAKQSSWVTSQAFSLPGDVAPGQSVTVTVNVTAPNSGGSMYLEVEMIKEHQFWFTQVSSVSVTVS